MPWKEYSAGPRRDGGPPKSRDRLRPVKMQAAASAAGLKCPFTFRPGGLAETAPAGATGSRPEALCRPALGPCWSRSPLLRTGAPRHVPVQFPRTAAVNGLGRLGQRDRAAGLLDLLDRR